MLKPVFAACGAEAARWYRELNYQFMKPTLDMIDCALPGDFPQSTTSRQGSDK